MSETQQTTGDRIMRLIESRFPDKAAQIIAAEIDALTRERDDARAQAIEANTNAAYAQTHEESLRMHKASLIKKLDATEKQLAEARAYISTIIDAPKDYPAEVSE